jgi:hypothetical protein
VGTSDRGLFLSERLCEGTEEGYKIHRPELLAFGHTCDTLLNAVRWPPCCFNSLGFRCVIILLSNDTLSTASVV